MKAYIQRMWKTLKIQPKKLKIGLNSITDTSLTMIYRWQISIWDVSNVVGKMRLKELWNTTTHLLEWHKKLSTDNRNANKDVEWENLTFTIGEKVKWYRHFGRQSDVFLKNSGYLFFSQTKNCFPWYLPKRMENCSHKQATKKPTHGCF